MRSLLSWSSKVSSQAVAVTPFTSNKRYGSVRVCGVYMYVCGVCCKVERERVWERERESGGDKE
jgi:hypothetical protein